MDRPGSTPACRHSASLDGATARRGRPEPKARFWTKAFMIRSCPVPAALLLLAACSTADQANNASTANVQEIPVESLVPQIEPANTVANQSIANDTAGGDGSQIELAALGESDLKAETLEGELGCSFSVTDKQPLLVAMGNVKSTDAAQGLVKIGSYVERIAAPGGYDAIAKGATFSGKGKTVRITPTGPAQGGGESPPRPATLTYDRADGAQRLYTGRWICGP